MALIVYQCSSKPQHVEITPEISVDIPRRFEVIVNEPEEYLKTWATSTPDDDLFIVYRYIIDEQDSLSRDDEINAFKNNIDDFIRDFGYQTIDSTFTFKEDFLQSDLNFDFTNNRNKFRFFGRFVLHEQYFIAFCFQSPHPVDRFSTNVKDKIFTTIHIN